MKNFKLLIYLFLFVCNNLIAQETTELSYSEIDSLMYICYQNRTYKKAIVYMKEGRVKAKIEFGQQDSMYAEYTANLAFFYRKLGKYQLAEPLYIESNKIWEKVWGKDDPNYANYLNDLAQLYEKMGRYEQALHLHFQAKKIRAKALGKEHTDYAASLNNIAMVYQNTGRYEQALSLFIQTINIDAKTLGKEHPDYAISINNLALLYKKMKQYKKALPLLKEAQDIWKETLGKEHHNYAHSLNNISILFQSIKQYEKALPLAIEAKSVWGKILGEKHPHYALSLYNLASLYQNMQLNEKALPLAIEAKEIRLSTLGNRHPDVAISFNNLTRLYDNLGNKKEAWKNLGYALASSSGLQISSNITQEWADSLNKSEYASLRHIQQMLQTLDISFLLLKKEASLSNIAKQLIVSNLAAQLLEKWRNEHQDDKDKLRILALSNKWMLKSLRLLDNNKESDHAFTIAEKNKSVLLLQASKSENAYQMGNLPDSLVTQENKLFKKKDKLQAMLVERRSKTEKDSLHDVLNNLNGQIKTFVEIISTDYPEYIKFKYQNIEANAKDIQKILAPKTALLEYVVGDSLLHIFYISKEKVTWIKSSFDNKELTRKIKAFHDILSDYSLLSKKTDESYQKYTFLAHWFYNKMIQPVLEDVENIEQLIIVPHGELGHLPFESFLVEQAPQIQTPYSKLHYLVNDYSISYNYSATLWKDNKERPKHYNNGQVLAMAANYDLDVDSTASDFRLPIYQKQRQGLSSLASAREEIELLSKDFNGLFVFDKDASEKTFKEKAANYTIIHLAMHGLLEKDHPILSSLAFSEDNDSVENNFLQAYEISKLKLNTDLVILSACETGFGKFEKGNGIASLARAFMYAGASSLIVTLWQVNDIASAEIMKRIYQNLAKGKNKAEALRQAKLDFINSAAGTASHPAYWSPFILIGNTDPIEISKKRGFAKWSILLGSLALIAILGRSLKRRKNKS
jgi:CHAT domain-containing protein